MSIREPQDPRGPVPPEPSNDPTALMDRPMFSDDHGAAAGPVFDSDEIPPKAADGDTTDPNQQLDLATGRFLLEDFEGLPSAHVSELEISSLEISGLEVSHLDGDVHAGGAETAVMQLPPEMLAHRPTPSSAPEISAENVEMRRWSAGRSAPPLLAPAAVVALDQNQLLGPGLGDFPTVDILTSPARLIPAPLPLPDLPPLAPRLASSTARQLIEDALAAVGGAQSCAAAHPENSALHRHLGRAVMALGQLLDETD